MTVITKNGFCPACMMTKKVLKAHGVSFTEKHIDDNLQAKKHLHDLGIKAYPIVEPNNKLDKSAFWGFRPERLNA